MSDLLSGISLERNGHNFRFRFPNNASCEATMPEVLLFELLNQTKETGRRVDALEEFTQRAAPAISAAQMLVPIGSASR